MRYFIGGISGVGKSTFVRSVVARQPNRFQAVHVAGAFMDFLGFDKDYEKLRSLPDDIRDERLFACINELIEKNPGESLFDFHYLNIVRGKMTRLTGPWLSDFDALILITADSREIVRRIMADPAMRDRALFKRDLSPDEMTERMNAYARAEKHEFTRVARKYRKPHLIINKDGDDRPVAEFLEFDKKIRNGK